MPLGSESGFNGWVDLVDERVLQWQEGGATTVTPWDEAARAQWQAQRDALVEAVADHDEELADAWLEGRVIGADMLRAAIRRATLAGAGVPVLAGAAFRTRASRRCWMPWSITCRRRWIALLSAPKAMRAR